ncbi:MAG: hypothetical protein GY906_17600, partial [bacterium]|nr:hypothetical protein [bacterium]
MKRTVTVTMMALAVAGFAAADQGLTEIGPTTSFPIVIDTPGSYVLTADLHVTTVGVNGIQIDVDNVTLDLGGHVIRGPGVGSASGTGIYGYKRENVTIRNGAVTEFANGINLDVSTSSYNGIRLRDLTVSYCTTQGVKFDGGTARDIVVHNIAYAGGSGNGLRCSFCSISN